jgi:glycosyltransferase involved in cell wall biosynthesis
MFILTSMGVGGAETLLVNLIRRMDRTRFAPEICCLKSLDELGELMAAEVPAHAELITGKYDIRVLGRLTALLRQRRIDAIVTVGTGGDRMFWGRLAAYRAGVPVVLSAIHSTGHPDHVEWQNRLLTPLTDGFIAVARPHARHLIQNEGCPLERVYVIPNGVDTERFRPLTPQQTLRTELGLPVEAPLVAILAALRPEKNHELFLRMAARVRDAVPQSRFLLIGDGPRRAALEQLTAELKLREEVQFLGIRQDIPQLLSAVDVVALTSHMEANPVSILEALACEKPVVSTHVGSIGETVEDNVSGFLVPPGDEVQFADRVVRLLQEPLLAQRMGRAGRDHVVAHWSLDRMVEGYQNLIYDIYASKCEPGLPLPIPVALLEPELEAATTQ